MCFGKNGGSPRTAVLCCAVGASTSGSTNCPCDQPCGLSLMQCQLEIMTGRKRLHRSIWGPCVFLPRTQPEPAKPYDRSSVPITPKLAQGHRELDRCFQTPACYLTIILLLLSTAITTTTIKKTLLILFLAGHNVHRSCVHARNCSRSERIIPSQVSFSDSESELKKSTSS